MMALCEFRLGLPEQTADTAPPFTVMPRARRIQQLLLDPSRQYLRVPLRLDIERTQKGHWLVTSPGITTHGVGGTPEDAVADFQTMLHDLFRELQDSEEVLAPHLLRELDYLRTVLV